MDFVALTKERFSVRKYENRKVEKEKLDLILQTAHYAPTAANFQPVRLLVVEEAKGLSKIATAANIFGAPLAIIVCSYPSKAWRRSLDGKLTDDIDASIVTDHMMLAAQSLGLGSVWICQFKPEVLRKEFKIPEELVPVNVLAIGYSREIQPKENRHEVQRISMDKLVMYETFGGNSYLS